MTEQFTVGEHVSWNSEAGRVSGTITKVHTRDFEYNGHTRRASEDEPQYEIASDKTDHVAAHKGSALTKLTDAGGSASDQDAHHGAFPQEGADEMHHAVG